MAAGFNILPAHYISNISASEYLEKYNYDVVPGSGPYYVKKEDVEKGRSIIARRRSDYWAEKERFSIGLNNFDIFKTDVVSDESLDFEKFKKRLDFRKSKFENQYNSHSWLSFNFSDYKAYKELKGSKLNSLPFSEELSSR